MPHSVSISTPTLLLREFEPHDLKAIYEFASDPEVLIHSPWGLSTLDQTRSWLSEMRAFREAQPRLTYEFAITRDQGSKVIGTCRFGIKNLETREAYIGYTLRKDEWGKGYATEVARALLTYGFETLGLHRIFATSSPLNIASHRVLEKVGMTQEGVLRKNVLLRGAWRDSVIYSILEDEWSERPAVK
jgi:ribosomal-protein-alanine N-acetyltransferase